MAKKPEKLYLVHAELHRISDVYGDQLIESHDLERIGVSEKQVISRLRYTMNWYDTDNYDGSVSFEWRFKLTVKVYDYDEDDTNYKQLSLFDNNLNPIKYW